MASPDLTETPISTKTLTPRLSASSIFFCRTLRYQTTVTSYRKPSYCYVTECSYIVIQIERYLLDPTIGNDVLKFQKDICNNQ